MAEAGSRYDGKSSDHRVFKSKGTMEGMKLTVGVSDEMAPFSFL